jgi:hypothetical protein
MSEQELDWSRVGHALRRAWLLLLLGTVLATAVAYVVVSGQPTVHRATGKVIVAPETDEVSYATVDSLRLLSQPGMLGTLAELFQDHAALEQASEGADVGTDAVADYTVSAEIVQESMVLAVHVDGPDGAAAERLGESVMARGAERFQALYPVYRVDALQPPTEVGAVGVSALQLAGAAGVGTLGLLGLLVVVVDRVRPRRRRPPTPAPTAVRPRTEAREAPTLVRPR